MISVGICDNNINDIEELKSKIELYFSNSSFPFNIEIFKGINELHKYYLSKENTVCIDLDILFLNYNINNGTGFKMARIVRDYDDDVALVAICDDYEYMHCSYDIWSLSYEIKPVKFDRLSTIMDRFIKNSKKREEQGLVVKNGSKYIKLYYDEICYIESQNTVLKIHMNNYEVVKTYGKLDDMEIEIANNRFLRCHKSFLINMDYIKIAESYKFMTIFGDSVSIKQRESSAIKKVFYEYKKNKYFLKKSNKY